MSGGGRGFFGGRVPRRELNEKLRQALSDVDEKGFEAEASGLVNEALARFGHRDVKEINQHLERIKVALDREIEGTVDLMFGGSIDKHTYVDGVSDVDALVKLNSSQLSEATPEQAKDYFAQRLRDSLPGTKIREGVLAVTVTFSDGHEVQLLPAVSVRSGIKIPDSTGKSWSRIDPAEFSSRLSSTNQALGRKLVPTIKLVKAINAGLPEKRRLTGYHIEALATEIFSSYSGSKTPKNMLMRFFKEAPKRILQPIQDSTGQSRFVDEYLGPQGSMNRLMAADSISRVSRRMEGADRAGLISEWKDILDPQ